MSTAAAKTAFARRSYGHDGQPITFLSADRADNQPMGWFRGWFEDGAVVNGRALTHVMDPSWRVSAPVALEAACEDIEAAISERRWADRREGYAA